MKEEEEPGRVQQAEPPLALTSAFLDRAQTALSEKLKPTTKLLELRADGNSLSLQLELPGQDGLQQLDYVEHSAQPGKSPVVEIFGPATISQKGQGELSDNLFKFSEVDLAGISRAFPIAQMAVDPSDGRVERLVIRRFLPFSSRIRARVYVHSPRMSGSIDTNEKGVALKRR